MFPLFNFCRPGVPCYSKWRYYQHLAHVKSIQHQVIHSRQSDCRLASTQAHIEKQSCDRMVFDILRAIALIIMRYELHSASPPPGNIIFISSGISTPTPVGTGSPGFHSPSAFMTGCICSGRSTQNTGNPSASNCFLRFLCSLRICFPGAFSSTKAHLPQGSRTSLSGTPFIVWLVNFTALPPVSLTASTNAFWLQ